MIDFSAINSAALAQLRSLLEQWLPGGKFDGHEYKALNPTRADSGLGSFSINTGTGKWADFATGDRGGDPVSLFAYLFTYGDQAAAARELAGMFGIDTGERADARAAQPAQAQAAPRNDARAAQPEQGRKSSWEPITPVPAGAGPYPKAHIKRGRPDATWEYRNRDGALLGVVYRFTTSDGGKEILPCVYARNTETGVCDWRWMQWPEPRPLYGMQRWRDGLPVLVVEGEKCADVAHELLGDVYNVLSWPGGGKAVHKANWAALAEACAQTRQPVTIWPDADAQRMKPTKAEVSAGVDPASMPLLPLDEQPGMRAALDIAQLLGHETDTRVLSLPAPGVLPSGWDIADAIAEGWDRERLLEFIRTHERAPAQAAQGVEEAQALQGVPPELSALLIRRPRGGLEECRENVYLLLRHHPKLARRVALNEFSNTVVVTDALPWRKDVGEWREVDDLQLGFWCAQEADMVVRSESSLRAGVKMASFENRVHPVRDWLDGLRWDGTPRLERWLSKCLGTQDSEYSRLVGRYYLISMVARIYRPGCKVDTVLVLEGEQGAMKSSALRALAGPEFFGDTPFVMGDKDSFLALRGKWLYEIAELDSLNKAEVTRAKAFLSSPVDSYRAPYAARFEDHPRQCVFAATTNQYEYLRDLTGNRRFWPVRVGAIDIAAIERVREQLFAEAVHRFKAGEQWHPTREEFDAHFVEEIDKRLIDDPWVSVVSAWLDSPDQRLDTTQGKGPGVTTADVLLKAIRMDAHKIGGARLEASRVGGIMHRLGYVRQRRSTGRREWAYWRKDNGGAGGDDAVPL